MVDYPTTMRAHKEYSVITSSGHSIAIREFGLIDYAVSLQAMRDFALNRDKQQQDQIWLLQHPPVYTQGTNCTQLPLMSSDIPLLKTDRGGQITYHGPGQIVMYPLLNIRRYKIGVKVLVERLEQAVIDVLTQNAIQGRNRDDAPGVYVDDAKIAALGLRIRRGNSYHGLSLNVDMDLSPFRNIDPCGYQGLEVTQISDQLKKPSDISSISDDLLNSFLALI